LTRQLAKRYYDFTRAIAKQVISRRSQVAHGLPTKFAGSNLPTGVHSSTVWRTVKRFEEEGSVDERKNEGPHKLTELEEFLVISKTEPLCMNQPRICRFLKRNNFSHRS